MFKKKHRDFPRVWLLIQVWDHGRGGRLLGRRREDQRAFALREKTGRALGQFLRVKDETKTQEFENHQVNEL
jgi:hypothetical protein